MNILILCKGNICRSPFGESLLRLTKLIHCRSAAIESYHIGKKADSTAIEVGAEFGVDLNQHISRQVTLEDIEWADFIVVMDRENEKRILQRFPQTSLKNVKLLGESLRAGLEIPDPYKKGREEFRASFVLIQQACNAFIRDLRVDNVNPF